MRAERLGNVTDAAVLGPQLDGLEPAVQCVKLTAACREHRPLRCCDGCSAWRQTMQHGNAMCNILIRLLPARTIPFDVLGRRTRCNEIQF